jgi:fatty-acyl-CoA synthase
MMDVEAPAPVKAIPSSSKAWLRALELTASIPRKRNRILATVIEEQAARSGDKPALLSDRECMSYAELAARANQYARWALAQGLEKGEVVCLLMTNRPEYFACWLGITSVGGVVALLNTNLTGASLAHCINVVLPQHVVVAGEFVQSFESALSGLSVSPALWMHGVDHISYDRIDLSLTGLSGEPLSEDERRPPSVEDRALCIFTSGTTGLPKAANVSHARVMQWTHWFAGMMGVERDDRMYNCLPMYHSVGGVQATGAALVGGGAVVIREKFSASQFWSDVIRWDCTMFQYIGEFCRYLLNANRAFTVPEHRIRMACGNGMASEVWDEFLERFRIPRILEFYAATEGGVSLFNIEGKRGAIGRIPPYLEHRFSPALVKFDVDMGLPVRNDQGFCVRCAANEPGEALGKILDDPSGLGSKFEGYTDPRASEKRILRNVFAEGDAWVRTGDLMRRDEKGFFYFVDRIGDTFRWKGENVATSEVSEAISAFPGIRHANVYGVTIPCAEGRAGMAALVLDGELHLPALREHLKARLPSYARPLFLRVQDEIEVTGTFKYSKTDLVRQGYDPGTVTDAIYFDHPEIKQFVRLDMPLYDSIQAGKFRL